MSIRSLEELVDEGSVLKELKDLNVVDRIKRWCILLVCNKIVMYRNKIENDNGVIVLFFFMVERRKGERN